MYRFPLYLLFLLLPLISTKFFDTIFIPTTLWVDGNFEFTKVMFFQLMSGVTLAWFLAESIIENKKILFPKKTSIYTGVLFTILTVSTILSLSPHISLYGNGDKSHSFLMFTSLLWLMIVLYNTPSKYINTLWKYFYAGLFAVCLLSLKEYFFPTFDYGALSSRAIGSFGHPNYLSLYLIIFFPFLLSSLHKKTYLYLYWGLLVVSLIVLVFTKSILGIILGFWYIWLFLLLHSSLHKKLQKKLPIYTIYGWIFIVLIILWYTLLPPEKLHSFISRFYLWQTTLGIIFSDIKIFLFGAGLETLPLYFNSFKVPELYIFENFGFTADRPHNFVLYTFYHLWVIGLLWLISLIWVFARHIQKNSLGKYETALVLSLLFTSLNYPSVAVYICIVFFIGEILKKYSSHNCSVVIPFIVVTAISIFGSLKSIDIYQAEIYSGKNIFQKAVEVFPSARHYYQLWDTQSARRYDPLPSESYYTTSIVEADDVAPNCSDLTNKFPSVENYFYCGKVFESIWQDDAALEYYRSGLSILPDLWNQDSIYWQRPIIQQTISGNRFFSPKFSDLQEILEKLENK